MATDLERFRDHCRTMADGGHTPACVTQRETARNRWNYLWLYREWPVEWGTRPSGPPTPCDGSCTTDADKALFARLADEVDAYLTIDDTPLWEDA